MKNIICIFIVFLFAIVNVNAWSCRCGKKEVTKDCCESLHGEMCGWAPWKDCADHCYDLSRTQKRKFLICCGKGDNSRCW
jgi:hypothetical protein